MKKTYRNLDNTAKAFSLAEKKYNNRFRLIVILKEKINSKILESATLKTLNMYPSYKVKMKNGFFWNYLETNKNEIIVKEQNQNSSINLDKNNEYLFKVSFNNNKIILDMLHILTDGAGAKTFLKGILTNYLNIKYNLKSNKKEVINNYTEDKYLKHADKNLLSNNKNKKAFLIKEKSNIYINKTNHYILNLKEFKNICKKNNVSITEYLTALYIYAFYKAVYNKSINEDIVVTIPIDLRKHYKEESYSNFFTCMNIEGNVTNNQNISFYKILNQVKNEFKNKSNIKKIKEYLAKDVRLGTNVSINLVPLFIKKIFMKCFGTIVNPTSTTTLSNVGPFEIEPQYKPYIDNIMILVSTGKIQKVKCTICSYENNLTVTINSNLINNKLEKEFYSLLKKHVGKFKLETYNI